MKKTTKERAIIFSFNCELTSKQANEFIDGILDNKGFCLKEKNTGLEQRYYGDLGAYFYKFINKTNKVILLEIITEYEQI